MSKVIDTIDLTICWGFATYWSRDMAHFLAVVVMLFGVVLAMFGAIM